MSSHTEITIITRKISKDRVKELISRKAEADLEELLVMMPDMLIARREIHAAFTFITGEQGYTKMEPEGLISKVGYSPPPEIGNEEHEAQMQKLVRKYTYWRHHTPRLCYATCLDSAVFGQTALMIAESRFARLAPDQALEMSLESILCGFDLYCQQNGMGSQLHP